MKSPEESERDNLALAAELARQLTHDFSNFLYNLVLQFEINAASGAPALPKEWDAIQRESKKMARLLKEWDHFQGRFSYDETTIDLHEVIREAADMFAGSHRVLQLSPALAAAPLPIVSSLIPARHLLQLLIEDLFLQWQKATETVPVVSIQTEKAASAAIVHLAASAPPERWDATRDEAAQESLVALACRSLALRLGGSIERECSSDGRLLLHVAFPQP